MQNAGTVEPVQELAELFHRAAAGDANLDRDIAVVAGRAGRFPADFRILKFRDVLGEVRKPLLVTQRRFGNVGRKTLLLVEGHHLDLSQGGDDFLVFAIACFSCGIQFFLLIGDRPRQGWPHHLADQIKAAHDGQTDRQDFFIFRHLVLPRCPVKKPQNPASGHAIPVVFPDCRGVGTRLSDFERNTGDTSPGLAPNARRGVDWPENWRIWVSGFSPATEQRQIQDTASQDAM